MGKLERIYQHYLTEGYCSSETGIGCYSIPTNLVYDTETKVIYYYPAECHVIIGCMSPYISENGKYCRFVDGKFVEVG